MVTFSIVYYTPFCLDVNRNLYLFGLAIPAYYPYGLESRGILAIL